MKEKIPRTPFSTPLSGSAKETEMRLKNIFSGPKKRPPALFLALVFAMCIFCGNLVSCQVAEAERETPDPAASGSEPPAASQPAEPAAPNSATRSAYVETLEDLFYRSILPDGGEAIFEDMSENTFALADVDGDGREELVLLTQPNIYAGYQGYILDYDQNAGSVYIQFESTPGFTFYRNGALRVDDHHAQGSWTSTFWPHSLYTYQPDTDSYELAGHVDAWEKEISDINPDNLPPFPTEKDVSGAGILYYIEGASRGDEVDQSVYLEWLEPILGDAQPLELEYLPLTEENISRIKAGPSQAWTPVELSNTIQPVCLVDEPYAGFTREETALLEDIPPDVAEQLPRQAVDPHRARRQDYWHDMLLPVAYDEAEDVTIYFVVVPSSMPDIEPGASPDLYALERRGIVIRRGSFAYYGDLAWYTNAHYGSAPLFYAGDLDGEEGDTDPEAALALAWGSGTGCYVESLYVIDLDYFNMCYITPDYSSLPLEITVSPDGKTARLVSGEKELDVDLTQLVEPFKGTVEVGSQVRFEEKDGQIFCDLELDFSCMTLEYLASVRFPVIFEDGVCKLGPAVQMDSFV